MNENGERLVDFCLDFDLGIVRTLFQHKDVHKLTWKSTDQRSARTREHAIRSFKNGRATGIAAIHAEMLMVDLPTYVGVLCRFFNEVWE